IAFEVFCFDELNRVDMAANMQDFDGLMKRMLCPENETRSEAEKQYEQIPIPTKGRLLFQLFLDAAVDTETRSMCLVLLRRILSSNWDDLWPAWGKETQEQFCEQLLKSASEEQSAMLRKRLADVIAEVARSTIDTESGRQTWAGVLQFLEMCTTSDSATHRETGMMLIENVPSMFGCDQSRYMAGIRHMFQTSLLYAAQSSVRTAAVRAYVAFMCENEDDDKVLKSLSDQIPAVIQVCQHVVATEDDDDVPLQCLCDLATSVPKTLQPHLNDIFTLCASTVADKQKDDSYRHSSLEVMVSLCESATNMVKKKASNFIPTLLEQCLGLMTELEDNDEEWLSCDNVEEDSEEENAGIGESSLDRISCSLGGKVVLAPFLQIVPRLVQDSQNWKNRHAGIMGLSTIGEGCKRQMEPMIEDIVDNILPFLQDPHPRVRYAACNALGQMSTDFAPTLQKKCHEKVVNGLCGLLVDLSCPRVAAHAGAALVNFSEDCPKATIALYLPQIMEKLEFVLEHTFKQLLERGKKLVLEQVITTIASVADAAQDQFVAFYDRLIGPLKYILQNSDAEELKTLRGKTIECISLIGLAVGKEKFGKDANEIMQMLLANQAQFEQISSDDPQVSYMISAWARICKILGEEFAAYLPLVMPSVMQAASFKPDVTLMDDDEAAEQQEDPDWNFVPLGDQKLFGIKTSGLQDKATACEMLVCYARELKGAFASYVEPVTELMLPLLKFMFHDAVRSAAADCLPCLLECARGRGSEFRAQLWNAMLPAYKEAIEAEHDKDVLADQMHGIAQCVEELGAELLTADHLETICGIINQQMIEYEERRQEREKGSKDEDEDEEDAAEALNDEVEEETGVLARVSDVIHALFQAFGERFMPYFDRLEPKFTPLLDSRRYYGERQWALCIFDDLIEYGGQGSVKYQANFYGPMLASLSDEYPEVRQAAAYGFGIMGQCGGPAYAQACAGALQQLATMISQPDARSTEEGTAATENAISAVAKILKYNSSLIDVNAVIPTFLSWLPIWDDTDESPYVYGYFADLVESNNPLVLGDNNANLPRIFSIIVEAFHKGAFEEGEDKMNVKERLINIIKFMQSNAEVFGAVLSSANLDEAHMATLQHLVG
uniref:Importin N-terminal domain-containing protein n=9 Tax=Parascaris univalens TaxID=6257 RepID=A0A914ZIN3_PARUN